MEKNDKQMHKSCVHAFSLSLFLTLIKGICYGMQIIAKEFGGVVQKKDIREDGPSDITIDQACPLFQWVDFAHVLFCQLVISVWCVCREREVQEGVQYKVSYCWPWYKPLRLAKNYWIRSRTTWYSFEKCLKYQATSWRYNIVTTFPCC